MAWDGFSRRSPDQNSERLLSGFGDHLLRRRLADQRRASFFIHWVRRFAARAPSPPGATEQDVLQQFVDELAREGLKDWQVQELLGHAHVETTMIYAHVARGLRASPSQPARCAVIRDRSAVLRQPDPF